MNKLMNAIATFIKDCKYSWYTLSKTEKAYLVALYQDYLYSAELWDNFINIHGQHADMMCIEEIKRAIPCFFEE